MGDSELAARVAALEGKVQELSSVQDLLLRLMSTARPLDSLLDFYGATEATRQALHQLLDEQLAAVRGPRNRHPTFTYFQMRLGEIFPQQRSDATFVRSLIDTLRVERPAYRELHAYMTAQRWGE